MPQPAKPKHYPPFDASASRPVQPSLAARLPREVVANIMRLRVEGKTKYKAQWRRLTMASVCFQWWISADVGRAVACNGDEEVDAFRVSMYKRKLKSRTKELWIYCQRQALRHGRGKRVADLLLASKALEDVELDGWPLAGEGQSDPLGLCNLSAPVLRALPKLRLKRFVLIQPVRKYVSKTESYYIPAVELLEAISAWPELHTLILPKVYTASETYHRKIPIPLPIVTLELPLAETEWHNDRVLARILEACSATIKHLDLGIADRIFVGGEHIEIPDNGAYRRHIAQGRRPGMEAIEAVAPQLHSFHLGSRCSSFYVERERLEPIPFDYLQPTINLLRDVRVLKLGFSGWDPLVSLPKLKQLKHLIYFSIVEGFRRDPYDSYHDVNDKDKEPFYEKLSVTWVERLFHSYRDLRELKTLILPYSLGDRWTAGQYLKVLDICEERGIVFKLGNPSGEPRKSHFDSSPSPGRMRTVSPFDPDKFAYEDRLWAYEDEDIGEEEEEEE